MLKLTPPWVSLEVESRRLSWADLKYEKRLEVVPPGVHPIMIIDKASNRIWICVVMRTRYQGWNTCITTDRDGTLLRRGGDGGSNGGALGSVAAETALVALALA